MDVREGKSTFGLDLRSYPQEESRSCLANLAKNSAVELTGSRGEPTIVTLLIDIVSNCFLKMHFYAGQLPDLLREEYLCSGVSLIYRLTTCPSTEM